MGEGVKRAIQMFFGAVIFASAFIPTHYALDPAHNPKEPAMKTRIYKVNLPTVADTVYVQAAGKSAVRAAILDRMTVEAVEGVELVKLARTGKVIIGAEDDATTEAAE